MRTLTKTLAVLLVLLAMALAAAPSPAPASGYDYDTTCYADGYRTAAGFCYHASDGYWWLDGCSYRRYKQWYRRWVPGYGCYGGYWQNYYEWTYDKVVLPTVYVAPVYAAPTYAPALPTPSNANWRAQLLEGVLYRDRVRAEIEKGTHEHNQYLEALAASGLAGSGWPALASARYANGGFLFPTQAIAGVGYAANTAAAGAYGAGGQTVYGYGSQTTQNLYGAADANLLYQAGARLTQNAQENAGRAHSEFKDLVAQDGDAKARVAEIEAKARAVGQVLGMVGPLVKPESQSRTVTQSYAFGTDAATGKAVVPAPVLPQPVPPPPMPRATDPEPAGGGMAGVWASKCASCHDGAKAASGLTFEKWQSLSRETKAGHYQSRIDFTDPAKGMPRGPDGKGHKLEQADLDVVLRDVLSTQR